MIIAIDGPLASGKGTLARLLASHYKLPHLDTGSIYRATALTLIKFGHLPEDEAKAVEAAQNLDMSNVIDAQLRTAEVGAVASKVAAIPAVRKALFEFQRKFATQEGGAVLDGRDIGTVICPEADFKFFVTASAEVRAQRRLKELHALGEDITLEELIEQIKERDERDANRKDAPLKPADDSIILDTSELSIGQVLEEAIKTIDANK